MKNINKENINKIYYKVKISYGYCPQHCSYYHLKYLQLKEVLVQQRLIKQQKILKML